MKYSKYSNIDLLNLVLKLHHLWVNYQTDKAYNLYYEARQELEKRL